MAIKFELMLQCAYVQQLSRKEWKLVEGNQKNKEGDPYDFLEFSYDV